MIRSFSNHRGRRIGARCAARCAVSALLGVSFGASLIGAPVGAAPEQADSPEQDASIEEISQQLVERFAPVIVVKQQDGECDTVGEAFRPSSVDIVLDNPEIALRQESRNDPVVRRAPAASDLAGLGQGFFLDFPGSSLSPGCIYERDFRKYSDGRSPAIYAHIVQQPDEPDLLFVQYWFYWYYNDWNNKHESDWEGITLQFEASSVEQALATRPTAVGYSQHEGGERKEWDSNDLEREGDRPVVYPSAGSHASYFGSAVYLGRGASEGFGCDDTSGPSERVDPDVILLPDAIDDPDDPLAWLMYDGRWGERQNGSFNGPTGPAVKDRWLEPAAWFGELRDSSVVIPTGDSQALSIISLFCGVVEIGSRTLTSLAVSPARVIVGLLVVGLFLAFLVNRTDWRRVADTPITRRRRAGQIVRNATEIYSEAPFVLVVFGLVYIPAAALTGLLAELAELVPFVGSLLSVAGTGGGTSLIVSLLVGSFANLAAFMVVSSLAASFVASETRDLDAALAAARLTWTRRRQLLSAFVRSYFIVAVLLLTFIGVPWGIRQLVRYQFASQAVILDGSDGSGALRRSSGLVRGRWFHTAVVASVINGIVVVVATTVALLVLVLVTGVPIWVFSLIVSLVYALLVPIAAIAMTLLYGDARAEAEDAGRAALVSVD